MKRFLRALFLLPIFMLSIVGCKDERGTTTSEVHLDNGAHVTNSKKIESIEKSKEDETLALSSDRELQSTHEMDSVLTPDELVKKAMESQPTAKVTVQPTKEIEKPEKKSKPDPIRSMPKQYLPKIEFDEMSYDFGDIVEGDIIEHKFTFINTGKNNLSIKKASATCGCTKPSFPFIDIEPGESGYIGVTYNSVNKNGVQKPEITVYSNADPKEITLYLNGTVKPKSKNKVEIDSISTETPQDSTKL